MTFEIKKATRAGIIPLVGMFGKSGSGKTMSALLLGRGLAGDKPLRLIDTENGRGSIFADLIPGGYDVINLTEPFTPARYGEALEFACKGAGAVITDSLSHEHSGEGGVLEMQEAELTRMAGSDFQKRERCKMAAWIKPKAEHNRFINQHVLRTSVPLICCLRGQEKTHMVKSGPDKGKVITDEFSTPIFDPRFLFELLVCLETVNRDGQGGFVVPWKVTHPALGRLLPKENEQIGVKHGEAIAKWASESGDPQPAPSPNAALNEQQRAKKALFDATRPIHGGKADKMLSWLEFNEIFTGTAAELSEASAPDLAVMQSKAVAILSE